MGLAQSPKKQALSKELADGACPISPRFSFATAMVSGLNALELAGWTWICSRCFHLVFRSLLVVLGVEKGTGTNGLQFLRGRDLFHWSQSPFRLEQVHSVCDHMRVVRARDRLSIALSTFVVGAFTLRQLVSIDFQLTCPLFRDMKDTSSPARLTSPIDQLGLLTQFAQLGLLNSVCSNQFSCRR